jgi:hypothetical protein
MKRILAITIAASLGVMASSVEAIMLNPRGTGQVLIYPYYTVNAGYGTLLTIVNTTVHGKALKVRFHEGRDGRVVFAFNLYLSPYDVWVGQTFDTSADGSGGAAIATNDNSCTVPAFAPAPGGNSGVRIAPFGNAAYSASSSDGGPAGLDRTREGLVEVIEMGEIASDDTPGTMHTLRAISHVAGTPLNCAQVVAAWAANGLLGNERRGRHDAAGRRPVWRGLYHQCRARHVVPGRGRQSSRGSAARSSTPHPMPRLRI